MSLIEGYALTEGVGDRVSYRVEIRGGAERLSRALRFNGLVEQEPPESQEPLDPPPDTDALEFYFNP